MPSSSTSPLLQITVALIVLVAASGLLATPVAGHAYLQETAPANGDQLETTPDEVTLEFSGDGVQVAEVTVDGPSSGDVSGEATIDPDDTQRVTVPLDDDGEGLYLVNWEVLADDGHTTSGSFFFVVGDEAVDPDAIREAHESELDGGIDWLEAGGKGLALVGLVGLVGSVLVAPVAVFPLLRRYERREETRDDGLTARFDGRLRGSCLCLAVFAFVGLVVLGIGRVRTLGPLTFDTVGTYTSTPIGEIWVAQVVIAAGLVVAAGLGYRGRFSRRSLLGTLSVGSISILAGLAWTSHSATAIDRVNGFAVDLTHLLGASLWIGGLLVLAVWLSVVQTVSNSDNLATLTERIVRRFSISAIAGVSLVTATGLILAEWHVGTTEGLTATPYGQVLAIKLAIFGLALGFAAYNRVIVVPRLNPETPGLLQRLRTDDGLHGDGGRTNASRTLSRTVQVELVLLAVVLILAGVMTAAATAAVVVADGEAAFETASFEEEFDENVTVELIALPTQHERSLMVEEDELVVFEVAFVRNGEQVPADESVEFLATTADGETTIERTLEETDEGTYTTAQAFPDVGDWEIRVSATVDGSFSTAWFDAHAMPTMDHDHAGSEDDDAHDHADQDDGAHDHDGPAPSSDFPFSVAALLVLVYGAVGIVLETQGILRHERD